VSCSHCRYNNGISNPCCVVLFAATRRPCIPRWCAGERDTWLHCSTHSNCTTALQHTLQLHYSTATHTPTALQHCNTLTPTRWRSMLARLQVLAKSEVRSHCVAVRCTEVRSHCVTLAARRTWGPCGDKHFNCTTALSHPRNVRL
jgi:hypothetical protein